VGHSAAKLGEEALTDVSQILTRSRHMGLGLDCAVFYVPATQYMYTVGYMGDGWGL